MPNLSNYIDFSVQFDLTQEDPAVVFVDTGNYPSGVKTSVKGNFLITQPDMGNYGDVDFDNPDIEWDAEKSVLSPFSYKPRGACDGKVQNGTWTITYVAEASGYDKTVIKKTFYLSYKDVRMEIGPDFDVFTPSLVYKDMTDYTLSGYAVSVTRKWSVLVQDVNQTITGTSQNQDLSIGGKYYDSAYQATLASTVTYTDKKYSWLTIKTGPEVTDLAYANTPPSCKTLMDQLNAFGASEVCNCGCDKPEDSRDYQTAATLLNIINQQMADSNWEGLYANIVRFQIIVLGSFTYTNTGAVIPPYQYECGKIVVVNGGGTTSAGVDVIEFAVGDTGYPSSGDITFISDRLHNKNILFFSKGNVFIYATKGDYTYDPDIGGGNGRVTVTEAFYGTEGVSIGVEDKP